MSKLQVGKNAGIRGLVSFPGITVEGKQWAVAVILVGDEWELDLFNDAGRDDEEWPPSLPGSNHGTAVLTTTISAAECPNPTRLNGAVGTLVKTYFDGMTETGRLAVAREVAAYEYNRIACGAYPDFTEPGDLFSDALPIRRNQRR